MQHNGQRGPAPQVMTTTGVQTLGQTGVQTLGQTGVGQTPAPAAPDASIAEVIRLSRPLPGHREEIWEVAVRHPTFGDWIECGEIHRTLARTPQTDLSLQVTVDAESVARWFRRLTGLAEASLNKMAMDDARRLFRVVVGLVGQLDAGNSATPQSTSG